MQLPLVAGVIAVRVESEQLQFSANYQQDRETNREHVLFEPALQHSVF